MTPITRKRRHLEMQGFNGLDDGTIETLEPWLRMVPAVFMLTTLIATVNASAVVIFVLLPFAAAGVILPNHPFDHLYNDVIRRLTGGPRIPRSGAPRRFASGVATSWLLVTGLAFHLEATMSGTALGVAFVISSSIPVLTGFCLPAWVFGRLRRQTSNDHRRHDLALRATSGAGRRRSVEQ